MVGFKQIIILMFCISFCMSLGGYPSAVQDMLHGWASNSTVDVNGQTYGGPTIQGGVGSGEEVKDLAKGIIGLLFLVIIGTGVISLATGGNFAQIYTIPLTIAPILLLLALVPFSFIMEPSLPAEIRILFGGFIGILIIIGIIDFVRGGES